MSENKKYYYLKFKENYFDQDHVKVIEAMKNGYEYSLILLKLYLKSLKHEGQLKINERIPYSKDKIELLAGVIGHDPANVMQAISLAKDMGIMDVFTTGEMFMSDIQNFIGRSSTEGDRKREYRQRLNEREKDKCPTKRPPELELELELELNKNLKGKTIKKSSLPPYKKIVSYLNYKAKTNYRYTADATRRHIKARWNEGFLLADFQSVIDIKCDEWLLNIDMCQYLRPRTLFGTKFESYLNGAKKRILEKEKRKVNEKEKEKEIKMRKVLEGY